jgi:hypothetical protein
VLLLGRRRWTPTLAKWLAAIARSSLSRNLTSKYTNSPRKLLYVVNEDFAFLLNRLPMARAARKPGYEIHVATHVNNGAEAIEAEGFVVHPIPLQRGGISPRAATQ